MFPPTSFISKRWDRKHTRVSSELYRKLAQGSLKQSTDDDEGWKHGMLRPPPSLEKNFPPTPAIHKWETQCPIPEGTKKILQC